MCVYIVYCIRKIKSLSLSLSPASSLYLFFVGGFEWLSEEEIDILYKNGLHSFDTQSTHGLILEADVHYPPHLHEAHSDLPMCPERLVIHEEMLSPFQRRLWPSRDKKPCTRLAPNLYDKKKYVMHIRNAQFYAAHGLIISRPTRVLKFRQSQWLKSFIEFNVRQRALATTKFQQNLHKSLPNNTFGKTMENVRQRTRVEFITDQKQALRRSASVFFKNSVVLSEDAVIVQSAIQKVVLEKAIYVGFCVTDLSKLKLFQFHYDQMLRWYPTARLLFTGKYIYCLYYAN